MLQKLFSLSLLGLAAASDPPAAAAPAAATASCGACWEADTVNGGCKPQDGLMTLTCSGTSMVLSVNKCVMGNTNLSLLQLVDNNASSHCTMTVAPTGITEDNVNNLYIATVSLDCSGRTIIAADTSVTPNVPEKIKFDQTLSARLPDDANSLISFSNTNSVGFACSFPTDYEISDDYEVEASITASQAVDKDAKFDFSIGWYNSAWSGLVAAGAVAVGSTGYVGVSVTALPTGFEFTTHTCTIDHITGTGATAVKSAGLTHKILDNKVADTLTSAAVVEAYSSTMTKLTFRVFEFRGSTGNSMRMTCNIRVCASDANPNFCRAPAVPAAPPAPTGPASRHTGRSFIVKSPQVDNEQWYNQPYHERAGSDINGLPYFITNIIGGQTHVVSYNNPRRGTNTDWNQQPSGPINAPGGVTQINAEGQFCPTWQFRDISVNSDNAANFADNIGFDLVPRTYYGNWNTNEPASECGSTDPENPSRAPEELAWKNYVIDYTSMTPTFTGAEHNPSLANNIEILPFTIANAMLHQYTSTQKGKTYYVSYHKTKPQPRAVEFCERLNLEIARFDLNPAQANGSPNADDQAEWDEVSLYFKNWFANEHVTQYGTNHHHAHNGNMWMSGYRTFVAGDVTTQPTHANGDAILSMTGEASWCNLSHERVDGVYLAAKANSGSAGKMRCDRGDNHEHTVLCMSP